MAVLGGAIFLIDVNCMFHIQVSTNMPTPMKRSHFGIVLFRVSVTMLLPLSKF